MKLQYKELPGKVVSWDDATLTITHFISTETQDSGGDVMIAKGMQLRGKPVVLFQHGQDPVFGNEPIAKALKIEAGENEGKVGILATTQYFDDRKLTVPSSVGERLYMKAKDDTMPNWSIGFNSLKSTPIKGGRRVDEWELHEYSQVAVGMNKEATTLAMKKYGDLLTEPKFVIVQAPEGFADMDDFRTKTVEMTYEKGAEMDCQHGICKMLDGKPYPSEHACRLVDPDTMDKFRRQNGAQKHDGKSYDVIYGHVKATGKWEQQAYRYPKDSWSTEQASAHCKSHDGSFAAATTEKGGPGSGRYPAGSHVEGDRMIAGDATNRALQASTEATNIGTSESHENAASEHRNASNEQEALGNDTLANRHAAVMQAHQRIADSIHNGGKGDDGDHRMIRQHNARIRVQKSFEGSEIKSKKAPHELAHKNIHALHKEMVDDLKAFSKDDVTERGTEGCAKEALEDFADSATPHVEKYIKCVREMEKGAELPSMEEKALEGEEKSYTKSHKALHAARNEMIKSIHALTGDKSVVPSEAAKIIINDHHKAAMPHAKEFIKAWHKTPETNPVVPETKPPVLKLKPQAQKKVLKLKPTTKPKVTAEMVQQLIAKSNAQTVELVTAELRRLSGKVTK